MGKIIKFDPKRRKQDQSKWTRPSAYGVPEPTHGGGGRGPGGRPPRKPGWWVGWAWLALIAGAGLYSAWQGGYLA